jgi:hypothetical protein
MDAPWIAIICGIAGSAVGGFVGVKVAIASLKERVTVLESEVSKLREAKHEHAGFLTRHEMELEMLKRKVDQR